MPSKKNSVLIFEPQIFLKKTLTDQNLTFHLKNMKYSAAYFHMTTCDLGDQLRGPGTPAKMFLALLDGLQELHLDG